MEENSREIYYSIINLLWQIADAAHKLSDAADWIYDLSK